MIEIAHLSKNFGTDSGTIAALKDVSLSLAKGRSLALIGPTAAGKTVLLKCLVGLYRPDAGVIEIEGGRASRDSIGMLFQQNALFDSLSIWENIAFPLIAQGMGRRAAREMAVALLPKIGLGVEVTELLPADLSGGMRKRVGFARAIITQPKILLLDNPTAGLDPILAARIERMIKGLVAESGASVISVTSNMGGIYEAYDEIAVMDAGVLHWHGTSAAARESDNPYLRQILAGQRDGPIKVLAS